MLGENWSKSSYSEATNCLQARWQKSTYSNPTGSCVECRQGGDQEGKVQVRDTKQDGQGPVLEFSPGAWAEFLGRVRAGGVPSGPGPARR